jgi:hypothetical protein
MVRPMASTGIGTDIPGIITFPFSRAVRGTPDNLRIGTYKNILTPSFKTFTICSIQHFVLFPFIGNPKHLGFLLSISENYILKTITK